MHRMYNQMSQSFQFTRPSAYSSFLALLYFYPLLSLYFMYLAVMMINFFPGINKVGKYEATLAQSLETGRNSYVVTFDHASSTLLLTVLS